MTTRRKDEVELTVVGEPQAIADLITRLGMQHEAWRDKLPDPPTPEQLPENVAPIRAPGARRPTAAGRPRRSGHRDSQGMEKGPHISAKREEQS